MIRVWDVEGEAHDYDASYVEGSSWNGYQLKIYNKTVFSGEIAERYWFFFTRKRAEITEHQVKVAEFAQNQWRRWEYIDG